MIFKSSINVIYSITVNFVTNSASCYIRFNPKKLLLVLILITNISSISSAFDKCNEIGINHNELKRQITEIVNLRTPVKYHNLVQEIELVTTEAGTIIPYATESQGSKILVFPSSFAKVMCQISLATYIQIEGINENVYYQAANDAGQCFNDKKSESICLSNFGNQLAKGYHTAFSALSKTEQDTAYHLFEDALNQVLMHEYAHHFLNHFKRTDIRRVDAEFEADLFAIMNGVQAGDASSSMFYFFHGLAEIEKHTHSLMTEKYESGSCRAQNVEQIVRFTGVSPLFLLDAAFGGGYMFKENSPKLMQTIASEMFSGVNPTYSQGNCGKLNKKILVDAYLELKQLFLKITENSDLLLTKKKKIDLNQLNTLIDDLIEMSIKFHYMNGLAAKAASLVIRKKGLDGQTLLPLVDSIVKITNSKAKDSLLSGDVGRLFQAHGFAILQEQVNLPVKSRIDKAFSILQEAVLYNPTQSESWMNLAMISFIRGQCEKAVSFSELALATSTNSEETQKSIEFFVNTMKKLSQNEKKCKEEGANFHPYPGL